MPSVRDSIDVNCPLTTVYNQWTQFEDFPKFMEGISQVEQIDDTHVRWVAEMNGEEREWTTEITQQEPDHVIAWRTVSGEVRNDGRVLFEEIGDTMTRIDVEMHVESGEGSARDLAADLMGMVKRRVHGDLERFKETIESRGEETGAWRGEVHKGGTRL